MKLKSLPLWSALALSLVAMACEKSSPASPSQVAGAPVAAETVTDATSGVTVGAPQPVSPADSAQFKNVEQPIKVVVNNGLTTGSSGLTYTFEVATDSAFASKVYTKENVAESAGQTSLTLDKLGAAKTYYWRVRSSVGGVGPYSRVRSFTVGPEVVLQTPVLLTPSQNGSVIGATLSLTVQNVGKTGPAGQIIYRFEVSDSSSFGRIVSATTQVEQGGGQTSIQVPTNGLTSGATYFWRVQASDPSNAVTTPNSAVFAFQYVRFSLNMATILDHGGDDFADWPETTMITELAMLSDGINAEFSKKDGPDRWPDIVPPGFDGPIEYCMGMAWNIGGHWYASAPIEMWNGRDFAGGEPQNYAINWFYDPRRWAPMTFNQPSPGDTIGFFVTAGDTRGFNKHTKVQERSNVVLVPMPDSGGAIYRFAPGSSTPLSVARRR